MADETLTADDGNSAGVGKKRFPRALLVAGVAAVVATGGIIWLTASPAAETTDNAYVAADTTTIAPRIRGFVAKVLVRDNQQVKAGDPLVVIEGREFDARLESALAELAQADANVAAAKAALSSQSVSVSLAQARVSASQSALKAASAEEGRALSDRRRNEALAQSGAIAARDIEAAQSTAIGAQSSAEQARSDIIVKQREVALASARRPELEAALQQALSARARAQAAVTLARQDSGYTFIRAPIDGVVGNKKVRVGDYVQPGTYLLGLVPQSEVYVVANYKETQTERMHPGQAVTVKVDALGDTQLRGRIESLAPGTASSFALLPFEPGTGNFTKIVQRVPVRISLEQGQKAVAMLRPGLSVTARVEVAR
ncbi:HlyD family secretion protein [Novosphingobium olei]|uniref:HlyD family secretion protein n=1 Tax=Novosphingobium olei TaxID=2728851 RepID=UPI00309090FF|nr:HlyD family secretion protein [Novosphingobium olei]